VVESAEPRFDLALEHQGQTFHCEGDQLEIGAAECATEFGHLASDAPAGCGVALAFERDRRLVQREPTVLGARLASLQKALRTREPTAGDRELAPELEYGHCQPDSCARRAGDVPFVAEGVVGALESGDCIVAIV
jgi:hypothetical protein